MESCHERRRKTAPITDPDGITKSEIKQRTLRTRDDVKLYYEIVGQSDRTIVLANGLGGRLYSWGPILRNFRDRYRFISWDYRGLFESGAPEKIPRLSIPEHAEDLKEILKATQTDSVVVAGWSMGVQVGLEFASLFPDKVDGLILLNGTYGQVFRSGFQPLFSVPMIHRYLHSIIEWAENQQELIQGIGNWVQENLDKLVNLQLAVSPGSSNRQELRNAMRQYLLDIFATDFDNYLHLFQELDAHSVYHELPSIDVPALVISGQLDVLTPPYQSRQIAQRMPNARHRKLWFANHFSMLEYPDEVVAEVEAFLDRHKPLSLHS
jgi:pimeloyl-ACP methyl ester carboxylesterase